MKKKIEDQLKKKVAVIRVYGAYNYDSYGDYSSSSDIVKHVTDWHEVTIDEFNELHTALRMADKGDYRHMLIEQMDTVFIANTVKDYQKYLKEEAKRYELARLETEKKAAEAKAKREQKKLEKIAKDKKKFVQMAAEMGLKIVEE